MQQFVKDGSGSFQSKLRSVPHCLPCFNTPVLSRRRDRTCPEVGLGCLWAVGEFANSWLAKDKAGCSEYFIRCKVKAQVPQAKAAQSKPITLFFGAMCGQKKQEVLVRRCQRRMAFAATGAGQTVLHISRRWENVRLKFSRTISYRWFPLWVWFVFACRT